MTRRQIVDKHFWWDLADIPYFFFNLLRHGLHELLFHGRLNIRMEVWPGQKEGLRLVNTRTGEPVGQYNEAHECPIDCP